MKTKLKELVQRFDSTKDDSEYEEEFLKTFQDCLEQNFKEIVFEFDGEGAYFGKQCKISFNEYYYMYKENELNFEIAYDFNSNKISIYKENHNGFWVCSFYSGPMTDNFKSIFKKTLLYQIGVENEN